MSKKEILKKLANNEISAEEAETMLETKEVSFKATPKGCIGIQPPVEFLPTVLVRKLQVAAFGHILTAPIQA